MNKLKLIIGPAPSELSYEALLARLSKERERISSVIEKMRMPRAKKAKVKKKKKATKVSQADLLKLQEASGVDLSSLMK